MVSDIVLLPRLENAACPVKALQAWRAAAGLVKRGLVFSRLSQTKNARGEPTGYMAHKADGGGGTGLSTRSIADTIERIFLAAKAAAPPGSKLHELEVGDFAGHSLRRGMATALAESGGAIDEIQATLRHRSVQTTMGYVHTRNPRRVGAVRKAMDESVKLNARTKHKSIASVNEMSKKPNSAGGWRPWGGQCTKWPGLHQKWGRAYSRFHCSGSPNTDERLRLNACAAGWLGSRAPNRVRCRRRLRSAGSRGNPRPGHFWQHHSTSVCTTGRSSGGSSGWRLHIDDDVIEHLIHLIAGQVSGDHTDTIAAKLIEGKWH